MIQINKSPLFEKGERKEMADDIGVIEHLAAEEIAKHPERRKAILQRLNRAAEGCVAARAHHRRKSIFFGSLLLVPVGLLIGWTGDAGHIRIVVVFGVCLMFSGVPTALLNIPIR